MFEERAIYESKNTEDEEEEKNEDFIVGEEMLGLIDTFYPALALNLDAILSRVKILVKWKKNGQEKNNQ
ncbi:hypothetical protein V1477_002814 [Vespula maculifrons]|uniref:Uncharacterized protein n=3 Tax=Vespula TaxID=7451 RepID=A0A834PGC1_VESPE|nr:hypothetical protein HZH66_001357 [Vespula vulgaris]KAF7439288.1 hypothetical protein H0235_001679 [Vespula pensylvanica]